MHHLVEVNEAQSQLSKLLDWVIEDDEVTIVRSGRPIARLVALKTLESPRQPGNDAGKVIIASNFDASIVLNLIGSFPDAADLSINHDKYLTAALDESEEMVHTDL